MENDLLASRRNRLEAVAASAIAERGLDVGFKPDALLQAGEIDARRASAVVASDMRELPWCSIDNDDSLDLDQLSVAIPKDGCICTLAVAIADVAGIVPYRSPIDAEARRRVCSIYTPVRVFPMIPEALSTDATSLRLGEDRRAVVIEMDVMPDGSLRDERVYPALVRSSARLSYSPVTEWFEGKASLEAIDRVPGLGLNVRMQERAAKALREARMARGAIDFESKETKPRLGLDGELHIEPERSDRAKEFIAECMIAANGAVARFIKARGLPTLRRVVRVPKRWSRIVALAAEREYRLAEEPDPKALADFLTTQRARDPEGFPSLSLATMKLMGAGEYVAQYQGEPDHGHFALATREYAHSTAPNRRYPDVATQRLLMAAFGGTASPFLDGELDDIARECTDGMNRAAKIERQVDKAAVAMVLESRIGEEFDAMVTGAAEKGTWVKVLDFEAEGRLARGFAKVDVGDTVRVKLHSVDVDKGHIDFVRA